MIETNTQHKKNIYKYSGGEGSEGLLTVEGVSTTHTRTAVRVPLLSEICLRAVGTAVVHISEQVALNGGSRPAIKWMQVLSRVLWDYVLCGAVKY